MEAPSSPLSSRAKPRDLRFTSCQTTLEVASEKTVKQMFPGLAAHRQPAGAISAGMQSALHRLANIHILCLHPVTHRNALRVVLRAGVAKKKSNTTRHFSRPSGSTRFVSMTPSYRLIMKLG